MEGRRIISTGVQAICVGLLLVIGQHSAADDLIEIYQKALQNDPQILGAGFTHAAAGESIKEARGRMLPQLGFEFSRSHTNQDIKSSENSIQQAGEIGFATREYSLTLTQPLFDWTLYMGYKQAGADVLRADAELASIQQDLILRTVERYLEALAAADEVGFAEAEKAAVQMQLELVQGMMDSGMARKTELYC